MRCVVLWTALAFSALGGSLVFASDSPSAPQWSASDAAKYLDYRATWWQTWPPSQRDHKTVCVSCHTILPYVLSRQKLSAALNEKDVPGPTQAILDHVRKRVSLWSEVEPYYTDSAAGPGKSKESRSTESVLNALVLASNDAGKPHLDALTRTALKAAWDLQIKTGDHAGAWVWQVFHLAPWESTESQYQGAAFMALAVGWAPQDYRRDAAIQKNLKLLRSYLKREYNSQPLLNRVVLMWASGGLPGLLSKPQKHQLVEALAQRQQADGGWSLASLGEWSRSDHSPEETVSDGYATGLVTLVLEKSNGSKDKELWMKGRSWLATHQNKEDGSWQAYSVNKKRDPKSDVGRFMTDAATGYAVLALTAAEPR